MAEIVTEIKRSVKTLVEREFTNARNSALNYVRSDDREDQVEAKIAWGRVTILNELSGLINEHQVEHEKKEKKK